MGSLGIKGHYWKSVLFRGILGRGDYNAHFFSFLIAQFWNLELRKDLCYIFLLGSTNNFDIQDNIQITAQYYLRCDAPIIITRDIR